MIKNVDPWLSENNATSSEGEALKFFEDNFVKSNTLPDSEAYISGLERKLARIKQGKPRTEKALLESLENKRKDCIVRLLTEDFSVEDSEIVNEEDIPTKWLKSYINPQQPLTVGELVELLKADFLAKSVEVSTHCEKAEK
uniref:Uncharacterized protein n=1 Tax=Rhodnius prolixus TaxID=13249 RepID=T1HM13_RHOPR